MSDFFFLAAAGVVLLISWTLFSAAAGSMSLRRLNIVSWNFYVQFLGLTFVGAVLAVVGVSHYVIDKVAPIYRLAGFAAICYVMVATPLTMVLSQRILFGGHVRGKLQAYFAAPLTTDSRQAIFWIALSIVALLATVYVYVTIQRIPFVSFLMGSSTSDLAVARIESARGFGGIVYIRNILSLALAPIVAYAALAYAMLYRTPFYRIWFLASVILAAAALTYAGEKSPIILFIASLYFAYCFVSGGASRRMVLIAGLGACFLLLGTYVVFNDQDLSIALARGLVSRLFQGQYAGLPVTFATFPNEHDFLNGASFPAWIATLTGQEHMRSARLIMQEVNPTGVEQGIAGVMNSIFVAEAWANFGWAGLLLGPIWVGFLMQATHNFLLGAPKTPLTVAAMTYCMTVFPITGGFVEFFWNPLILILGALGLMLSLVHIENGTIYLRTKFRWRRRDARISRHPFSPDMTKP